jgi:hypothetical protein
MLYSFLSCNHQVFPYGRLQAISRLSPRTSYQRRPEATPRGVDLAGMDAAARSMEESVAQFLPPAFPEELLRAVLRKLWTWVDVNVIDLGR